MRSYLAIAMAVLISTAGLNAEVHRDRTVVILSLDGVAEYMLEDPQVPMPTLMRMANEGAKAAFMLPINPTITWPNHTSIVTGVLARKHLLLFNGQLEWPTSDGPPHINEKAFEPELVHFPALFDVAHQAGLTTGQVDWPATDGSPNIDWAFGECPDPNNPATKEVIAAGLVDKKFVTGCLSGPQAWRNRLWSDAAVQMIEKHHPNLMLIHLLAPDSVQHMYGSTGFASAYALAFSDDRIRDIVDAIRRAGIEKTTTVFVVSDHGHRDVDKAVHPDFVLRHAGIMTGEGKGTTSPVWIVPDAGAAMVFIPHADGRALMIQRLEALYRATEGIGEIWFGDELVKRGLPSRAESSNAPDMVLIAASGYAFEGNPASTLITPSHQKSTHGFPNSDPKMHAIFVAWGANIRPGSTLPEIRNVDVAPTAAKILGLTLHNVDGRAVDEILR
jgi:predicted AlkP superfamily pyrophosphatase or phosphodiesterase